MDNWEHRSSNMLCKTCMYCVQKSASVGRCRRRAPTLNGWPVVFDTDWCGDHKLDEATVIPPGSAIEVDELPF